MKREDLAKEFESGSFDEKLLRVIKGDYPFSETGEINLYVFDFIHAHREEFSQFLFIKYEDLIGSQGGGGDELQKKTIEAIAKRLGVQMTSEKVESISKDLFGDNVVGCTFRKGTINQWEKHFKDEHKQAFEERWLEIQNRLGYSGFASK